MWWQRELSFQYRAIRNEHGLQWIPTVRNRTQVLACLLDRSILDIRHYALNPRNYRQNIRNKSKNIRNYRQNPRNPAPSPSSSIQFKALQRHMFIKISNFPTKNEKTISQKHAEYNILYINKYNTFINLS